MALISLNVKIVKHSSTVTMQFDGSMLVCDVCQCVCERLPQGQWNDHGLFKPAEDSTTGSWLNEERTLKHYNLKSGDMLHYKSKLRLLRVKTLDDSVKTLQIDGSQTVTEVVKAVCAKIGLYNPEEFSFTMDENPPEKTLLVKKLDTLKRKQQISTKLNWLKTEESLCEQGIVETVMLTLRKKFFVSDQHAHRNDPVQINLLYAQLRDAIINGSLPCTCDESVHLAALQCQIVHGNYDKHRQEPGFLDLQNFLPNQYTKQKGIEKLIFEAHQKLFIFRETDAKLKYIQFCQSLRTYGVTFFLVKEMAQNKKKLIPCLLGITRESVIKVDSNTKAILKTWPLSTVRRWGSSPNTFTLDFGVHSESTYSVWTSDGEAISRLIAGYADIVAAQKSLARTEDEDKADLEMDQHACSLCSTTNLKSANMDEPEHEWHKDHSSLLEDKPPELPMRGYLQDTDFMKREFLVDPHTASMAMEPARYEQPPTFVNQPGENISVNQLIWQDKMETNDYMTLIRKPEESDNVYQSLTFREMTSPSASGIEDEEFQGTENVYQPLDLMRMNQPHDSSSYQTLSQFYKD